MPVNLAYQAYHLLWEGLDWLYPPNCGGCGVSGARWCEECARKTTGIVPPICPICGNSNTVDEICQRCEHSRPSFTSLRSYSIFSGPMREAIHQFKYKHDIGLGEAFAELMIPSIQKLNWRLNFVASVPLGLVRFKERGYNQANLLARPIALFLRLPFSSHALNRIKETRTQVGLTVGERQQNMTGAFKAQSELVQGKSVLLVDDVATSGATLNACGKALIEAGAAKVYAFTLARAIFLPDGNIDIS